MRYCTRCVLPDTKPGVFLDEQGVCSACHSAEHKKNIDWEARAAELTALCDSIRGKNSGGYDCIVPVSGGKDSFYQTYIMSKVHNLKVLCVIVAPHLQTWEGVHNLNALVTNLGADLLKINVKPSTLQHIRRAAFLKIGNPNWAEHRVVFSGVARAALLYNTPLVVWGEDIAVEYGGNTQKKPGSSAAGLIENDLFREARLEDLIGDGLTEQDLFFYLHPDNEALEKQGVRSIYMGYYYWWNGPRHYEEARRLGFLPRREGPLSGHVLDYVNIDEKLCEIHLWLKFLKHGFWRPTDHCCYLIWGGQMTRAEAVDLVNEKQYQFPYEYLDDFLEYHSLTEREFRDTLEKWRNPNIWRMDGNEWRLTTPLI
jgi:N-acetyl sugar amidotransferase